METNTLLTGLQELFTNAVKAEVQDQVGANARSAVNMDDVKSAIASEIEDIDLSDVVGDLDISDQVSNCIEGYEFVDRDDVQSIAQSQAEDYFDANIGDHCSEGMSLSDASAYLNQVADGQDCSDGEAFRNAVLAIVNTDKLKNGASVDDGTAMSVKASGTDHEIQAILARRRSYFETLHNRIESLFGSAPNGLVPPIAGTNDEMDAWRSERDRTMPSPTKEDQLTRLWNLAVESTKLLGLLSGLYNGMSGNHALRAAGEWASFAERAREKAKEDTNE